MSSEVASLKAVKDAVAVLRQQGVNATADRVVELIGGSKSTVLQHLRTLRTQPAEADELPAAVLEMARPLVRDIFSLGRQIEAERTQAANQHFSMTITEMGADIQKLAEENAELDKERAHLSQEVADRLIERSELRSAVQRLEIENKELRAQLAAAGEATAAEIKDAVKMMQNILGSRDQNASSIHRETLSLRRREGDPKRS